MQQEIEAQQLLPSAKKMSPTNESLIQQMRAVAKTTQQVSTPIEIEPLDESPHKLIARGNSVAVSPEIKSVRTIDKSVAFTAAASSNGETQQTAQTADVSGNMIFPSDGTYNDVTQE